MAVIRIESPLDYASIRNVTIDASGHCDLGYQGEADLIEQLRQGCDDCLSLVALKDGAVVGHILFSPAVIISEGSTVSGMGLAPMSVASNLQRQGIGSQLVTEGLSLLRTSRCSFVIVIGAPDYYSRFGFEPASRLNIQHGFAGLPQEYFLIGAVDDTVSDRRSGRAYFRPEFGPQHIPDSAA